MTTTRATTGLLTAAAAILMLSAAPSAAQDAEAVAERLKARLVEQGSNITWDSISGAGSQIVLVGVKAGPVGKEQPIGDITLDDVSEDSDGTFRIGTASLAEYSRSKDGTDLKITGVSMTGVTMPPDDADGPLGDMMLYETAAMETLTVGMGGKQVFTLNDLELEVGLPEGGNPMEFSGSAGGFFADLAATGDPKTIQTTKALGYEQITGSLAIEGLWQPEDGKFELSQYDITVNDAGTLGMTVDVGGLTAEFNKKMRAIQAEMTANPDSANQKQGEMMALMSTLDFRSASIGFEDDSLTGKLIDFFAEQQGMDRAQLVAQAKVMAPFVVMQLGSPELATAAGEAIGKFLDDPQNITIDATPDAPVPFSALMQTGMTSPQDLPKQLNVTITANE